MLPVLVCAEGFLLSHTSEVVEVPTQDEVDAFLPELRPPDEWLLDPARPRSFSPLPQPREYAAFQRAVADAMDAAAGLIEQAAEDFSTRFGRRRTGLLEVSGDPRSTRALVVIGSIGETALELLATDGDLLVVRVHAYRPFPAAQLVSLLGGVERVTVVDRAAAFGSLGPLGADVASVVPGAVNVLCGVGGMEVTPATLRWALEQSAAPGTGPVWAPEGV
jgi:pyruvate ferredoxin oxidoreductase alpha subunit